MFPEDLLAEATALLAMLRAKGLKVATAESCTGWTDRRVVDGNTRFL